MSGYQRCLIDLCLLDWLWRAPTHTVYLQNSVKFENLEWKIEFLENCFFSTKLSARGWIDDGWQQFLKSTLKKINLINLVVLFGMGLREGNWCYASHYVFHGLLCYVLLFEINIKKIGKERHLILFMVSCTRKWQLWQGIGTCLFLREI